jgi:hypothetical protein
MRTDAALGVFVVGLTALLGVAGCSGSQPVASSAPSVRPPSRGEVLRQALRDPMNVDVDTWSGVTVAEVDGQARQICADLIETGHPPAELWQGVIDQFGVSMSDADYFTRASVKLYCPAKQSTVGYL